MRKEEIAFTNEEKKLIIECLKKDLIDLKTQEQLLRGTITKLKRGELEKGHLIIILNSVVHDVSQRLLGGYDTEETRKLAELALKISKVIG